MAVVSNRSDCIIKNLRSEMKGVQEKESAMGVRGLQNKSVPRILVILGYLLDQLSLYYKCC